MRRNRLKKIIFIVIGSLFALVALIIIFISPITKYLVEKYDEKYTGRQITMDWAYVNPFTGYLHFSNLKIYESKSDTVFISTEGLSVNFEVRKMFSKTYEISELVLNKPKGVIIQSGNKRVLNFSDIIDKFSSKDTSAHKPPVHFSIASIKINEGEFHYREDVIPINYFIKKVNIESTGFYWNSDTVAGKFSFLPGVGKGSIKGDMTVNIKNLNYRLATIVHEFNLDFIEQYMKDFSNYGTFRASLDADIKATGNFNRARELDAKGQLAINDFHFGKNAKEDYASFERVSVGIINLDPDEHKYIFDSVLVNHPFFKYERYDHLDNIQNIFGKGGSNVKAVHQDAEHFNLILEIADYVEKLAKNFFRSYYKINHLGIKKADLRFNDYSLAEKFSMAVNPLSVYADSIDKSKKRVKLILRTGLKPYGDAMVDLSINPKDSGDFDLHYHLEKLPLAVVNPYLITYTSFPLDRGTMEFTGTWNVRSGNIRSENHLILIDPRTAKRLKNKDAKWIPVPLVMAFVRERSNVIDYEIPITGNLNNPKFHLKDVIIDLFENILIKPPTMPYIVQVKTIEKEIEKSLTLKWEMRQNALRPHQEKFVHKIAKFLKENPEASITVSPVEYTAKEKEYILFFESKKKYFMLVNNRKEQSFTSDDSLNVSKMSVKDSSFVKYLNKHMNTKMIFTIQEKCSHFIGNDLVNKKCEQLLKEREKAFMLCFKEDGTENRVKIHKHKDEIPFNGFSYFKIDYKGDIPKSLMKAYEELEEVNEKSPRDRYFHIRKKTEGRY